MKDQTKYFTMAQKITCTFFVLVFFFTVNAQDSTFRNLPDKWTLENCIEYAKQNNINVNSLRLNQRSTEEDLLQAKAARLPFVSGSVSQNLVNSKNANP